MNPNPRQAELLHEVQRLGSASVEALAERFGVTLQTVRRDVKLLTEAGLVARFHGGVRVPSSTTENIAYRQRQQLNEAAKQRIARAVAKAVPCGCSLRRAHALTSALSSLRSSVRRRWSTTGRGARRPETWSAWRWRSRVLTWSASSSPGRPRKSSSSSEPISAPARGHEA